jgi:hypothetical protein
MADSVVTNRKDGPRRLGAGLAVPVLLGALFAPACEDEPTTPDVAAAGIEVAVEPNPVVGQQNPTTFVVTATYKVRITEYKGLGGEVMFVSATVFDPQTGVQVTTRYYDNSFLKVGTKGGSRIEPLGELVVDPPEALTYVLSENRAAATLSVHVQVKDDRFNLLNTSVLVPIVDAAAPQ